MPTTYYVRQSGNDGNAGTSAGAAWATLGKALGAAGISSGDQVYIGSGTYREIVNVAMTAATAETQVIADVDGAKTGDAGPVIWTAHTTNDTTAPSSAITLSLSGKNFLTFEGFYFVGGTGAPDCVNLSGSTNCTFRRCTFTGGTASNNRLQWVGTTGGVAANLTVDSCLFAGPQNFSLVVQLTRHTADYDANVVIRNCVFWGSPNASAIELQSNGTGTGFGGGVVVLNCTFLWASRAVRIQEVNLSTSIPCLVYNCLLYWCPGTALVANTSGQIVEDYNHIIAGTARSNVTAGAHTQSANPSAYAPLLDWGYSRLNGFLPCSPWAPMAGAPQLGFGNQGSPAPPATDLLNRPRPAGGASTANAIGAFERHDTAVKETSVTDAGSVGLRITGPGDHDFKVPVNATSTTLSVRVRYDTNHGTTNKPQAILLASGEIGVATETKTATVGVNTWETLTFSAITPTAKGLVTIRLVSRAAAGSGIAYFDTLVAPDIDLGDFGHFSRGEPGPAVSGAGTGGGRGGGTQVVAGGTVRFG